MPKKPKIDWSNLQKDYEKYRSCNVIAKMYGCTQAMVSLKMKQLEIKVYSQRIEIPDVVELYREHKSTVKIAKMLGCTKNTVLLRLKESGINATLDDKGMGVKVGLGRIGEKIALKALVGSVDKTGNDVHAPFDIEWKGKRIDVKVSRPQIRHGCKNPTGWVFSAVVKGKCDYYFCIGLDENDRIEKAFLIPDEARPKAHIGIARKKSTYDIYLMEVDKDELNKIIRDSKEIG